MRATLLALSILICSCIGFQGMAQNPPKIKDSEAAKYVGKKVEVRGTVVVVYSNRLGETFIDFGGRHPRQTFTGFIPPGSELAGDTWTASLEGKKIGIIGTIDLYMGKPEIKVLSKSQIKESD